MANHKVTPKNEKLKEISFVPGGKYTEKDLKHLKAEQVDVRLLEEFKSFTGTIKEFMELQIAKAQGTSKGTSHTDRLQGMVFKQGLVAKDLQGITKAFADNEKDRVHVRSNNVVAYHNIISISKGDCPNLTNKAIQDIAQKFMNLRAADSLVVGALHLDRTHAHIHLIQSGTTISTGLSTRVSKNEFQQIKIALQEYSIEKHKLTHSTVKHRTGFDKQVKEKVESKNKTPERLYGNNLPEILGTTMAKATSQQHFFDLLKEQHMSVYYRDGRIQGVITEDNRKHRFSRNGIEVEKIQTLDIKRAKEEKSLKELRALRSPDRTATRAERLENLKSMAKEKEEKPDGQKAMQPEPAQEERIPEKSDGIKEEKEQPDMKQIESKGEQDLERDIE